MDKHIELLWNVIGEQDYMIMCLLEYVKKPEGPALQRARAQRNAALEALRAYEKELDEHG